LDLSALPFADASLSYLCWAMLVFWGLAMAVDALGFVGMLWFRFRPLPSLQRDKPLPGVSIIKACYANQDNEIENFDSFFNQDYTGPIEILFTISSESDPIVPVLRHYLEKYPNREARIVVSKCKEAYWNKVNGLRDAQDQAKYQVIIWSDSDVVVRANYVSQMVACLQEPGVSVVTTPQYDFRVDNFPTALKVLGNNCDDATFMMAYNLVVRKKKVALGQSIGFWASEFNSFRAEAWDTLNRFLADDLALPYVFSKHGKRVVFRNIYCPVQYSGKTFAQVIEQKRRWVMCQKHSVGNRLVYLTGCLFYPEVPAFFLMLLTGFSGLSINLFLIGALTRTGITVLFEALFLRSLSMSVRWFWTVPLWDLMQVGFVLDGFFRDTVVLGGKKFKVGNDLFLTPVEKA
jgi:ceramide glucosyltransferase